MTAKKIVSSDTVYQNPHFLRKRELGMKRELGYEDKLIKKLITALDTYDSRVQASDGGIFNLEFSLDGAILAAACEKKAVKLYDSFNQNLIISLENAHENCVNCIRFLDSNTFATGSDDNSIKLWDMRFSKTPTRTLRGHSNWVKNIEYSSKENRLVTSAFDGGIYSWDLNNFTEQGVVNTRIFLMDGLMRMKLTPDSSKMVICTTHGYMLLIHNINLESLSNDLQRFKPNIYRLMQESEQNIPIATCSNNLFSPYRKVNRVELISDFPNNAEVISSLQIHPMGWCALTRNISNDELTEWTSVHDIQERDVEEYLKAYTFAKLPLPRVTVRRHSSDNPNNMNENRQTPMDIWMGYVTNHNFRSQRLLTSNNRRGTGIRITRTAITVFNSGILSPEFPNHEEVISSNNSRTVEEPMNSPGEEHIMQNLPRLTHFMEEPNAGKGFIKEVAFSPDGRIICSPYHTGVRLYAFNNSYNELSNCVPDKPEKLYKVAQYKDYHSQIVVSCKFNPYHCILVSGCLGGQIVWYRPVF